MASELQSKRRHRLLVIGVASVVAVTAIVVALTLFQPWKLWIDDKVEQAAPPGARPVSVDGTPALESRTSIAEALPAPAVEEPVVPATAVPPTTAVPPAPVATAFVSRDHGTSGRALILATGTGQRFLRLEDLDTSNGPDLYVYLSTNPVDGDEGGFDDEVVNLGRLQGNIGSSNYEIPPEADLGRYLSVVIWCDRFNSAFGAAPLH